MVDLREIACPADDDDEDDRGLWFGHWTDLQMSTWLRMLSRTPDDQRLLMLKMIAKGPLSSASISRIKEQLGLDSDDDCAELLWRCAYVPIPPHPRALPALLHCYSLCRTSSLWSERHF